MKPPAKKKVEENGIAKGVRRIIAFTKQAAAEAFAIANDIENSVEQAKVCYHIK